MIENNFNRRILCWILLLVSFFIITITTVLLIYTLCFDKWEYVGLILLSLAIGLMMLIFVVNRGNDITIDYINKEVLSKIKFNKTENACIPFDSIIDVYIYNSDQLRNEIKLKKYPVETLVIKQRYNILYNYFLK